MTPLFTIFGGFLPVFAPVLRRSSGLFVRLPTCSGLTIRQRGGLYWGVCRWVWCFGGCLTTVSTRRGRDIREGCSVDGYAEPRNGLRFVDAHLPKGRFGGLCARTFPTRREVPLFVLLYGTGNAETGFFAIFSNRVPITLLCGICCHSVICMFCFTMGGGLHNNKCNDEVVGAVERGCGGEHLVLTIRGPSRGCRGVTRHVGELSFCGYYNFRRDKGSIGRNGIVCRLLTRSRGRDHISVGRCCRLVGDCFNGKLFTLCGVTGQ